MLLAGETNISNPTYSAVDRPTLVKKALSSNEDCRILHAAALVEVQKAQGAVQNNHHQQENSRGKAVIIPGPRSPFGGTDLTRQKGIGEVGMLSKISSPHTFTRSFQCRPKGLGKVLSSAPD